MKNLINLNFKTYAQIGIETYHSKKIYQKFLNLKQNIFKTIINYNKQKKLFLRKKFN